MLNFLYLYAIEWVFITMLCLLRFTDFGEPLTGSLFLFWFITISISLLLGYLCRKKFTFIRPEKYPQRSSVITVLIIVFAFIEYSYYGDIPLLGIIAGRMEHAQFTGIKTFHVILCSFTSFYLQYLFYLFICFPKKYRLLFEYFAVLFCTFCLQFNRGWVLITLIGSALMLLAKLVDEHKIKMRHIIYIVVIGIISLYLFGCMGNVRIGATWDDTSYFCSISKVNSRYPTWLPKQFAWAYIYITGSVASLNHNVINCMTDINLPMFFANFLPDFITKRIIPAFALYEPKLIAPWHTTYTGFGKVYTTGGIVGMYVFYFVLMFGNIFLLLCFKPKRQFVVPYIIIMDTMVLFMFFTNTIAYSAISFPIVYPILSRIVLYKPVKHKKHSKENDLLTASKKR